VVVELAGDDLVGGALDGVGDLAVEAAHRGVHPGDGLLDEGEGVDQRQRLAVPADAEIVARPFGLGAPVAVGLDFDGADGIGFGTGAHLLPFAARVQVGHGLPGAPPDRKGRTQGKIGLGRRRSPKRNRRAPGDPPARYRHGWWPVSRPGSAPRSRPRPRRARRTAPACPVPSRGPGPDSSPSRPGRRRPCARRVRPGSCRHCGPDP
jgi:hypothetical protein